MSSSGIPTTNYNLNQWQAHDKPQRIDFNSDNEKIDAALGDMKQYGGEEPYTVNMEDLQTFIDREAEYFLV